MNKLFTIIFICLSFVRICAKENSTGRELRGVLVYKFRPDKGEVVSIYKATGSLLRQLTVNDNLSEDAVIDPLAMKGESFLLVFDCLGATANEYKVLANSKTGLIGYIRKNDSRFKFKVWPDFIITLPVIGFNAKANPLHRLPDTKSPVIKYDADESYHPKLIRGD